MLAERKIRLNLDNFSGHILARVFLNVKLLYLPSGTTSVLQPLDADIIRSLKSKYTELLAERKVGSRQRGEAFVPTIKDAIYYAAEAWASVTERTIRNYLRKVNITNAPLYDLADIVC